MSSSEGRLNQICQDIIDNCVGCGSCISECPMLERIGEDLRTIAQRKPSVEEAYACSLCGLCKAVCPMDLSPKTMFAEARNMAVERHEVPINDYRYMFPDREANVMHLFREVHHIGYDGLNVNQEMPVAFFPGCVLLTYSRDLTTQLYSYLQQKYQNITLLTDCCGLPLEQLGLKSRSEGYSQQLITKMKRLKIKKVILACSNCYYHLRLLFEDNGIRLYTVYESLKDIPIFNQTIKEKDSLTVTIHDSCPDRLEGIFARQVREALKKKGYSLIEMEHSRNLALCCGSGGQISHFSPELADDLVKNRLQEAMDSKAQILAAYCLGCVLNLSKVSSPLQVQHVLNLLLEKKQDFSGLKKQASVMFEGTDGEKRWQRIMSE